MTEIARQVADLPQRPTLRQRVEQVRYRLTALAMEDAREASHRLSILQSVGIIGHESDGPYQRHRGRADALDHAANEIARALEEDS